MAAGVTASTPPGEPVTQAEAVPRARRTFGIIWLVPVIALGLALWVAWSTWSERGPLITVTFQTASGIETGKTKLRYRDIDIGQVESVTIGEDLRSVVTRIQVRAEASRLINDTSRFWVVRPRFGQGQVSGLETLVSGAYIEVDPGDGSKPQTEFVGLENPPRVRSDTPGRSFVLRAPSLGGIAVGSPVLFRGIEVGEVTDFDLPNDHESLSLHLFVRQPYAEFVRKGSRFWREQAISFNLGAEGVQFSIGNLETLLRGGVVFNTPAQGDAAAEGDSFTLFDDEEQISEALITERVPLISYFDGSVRGLSPGAPVEVRGMRIGTVRQVGIEYDVANHRVQVPVIYDIEPQRIRIVDGKEEPEGTELAALVSQGLRAQLTTGNLITGQLLISLDFAPDAPPAEVVREGDMLRMPTIPSSLDTIQRSLTGLLDQIGSLPLDDLVTQLKETVQAVGSIANSGDIKEAVRNVNLVLREVSSLAAKLNQDTGPVLSELQRSAQALGEAARTANGLISPRSDIRLNASQLMDELAQAARSVRDLADYLERHPDALLRGKSGGRN